MGAVSGSEGTSETSYSSNLSVLGRYSRPPTGKVSPKPLGGAQTDGPRCPTNLLKRRLLVATIALAVVTWYAFYHGWGENDGTMFAYDRLCANLGLVLITMAITCLVDLWYDHGSMDFPQSHTIAVKWFRKAVEQNHFEAESMMAVYYRAGWNLPQDLAESDKWSRRAKTHKKEHEQRRAEEPEKAAQEPDARGP